MDVLFSLSSHTFHLSVFSNSSKPSVLPFFNPKRSSLTSIAIPKFHHPLRLRSSALTGAEEAATAVSDASVSDHDAAENFDWYAQWYPVAPLVDLDKRRPHAKRVMGLDVVVWWDRNADGGRGRWRVFDDRCPHRLAPLSEGRVDRWGRLQCVYHGWCFDGSGGCQLIPQAPPDGPPIHTSNKACVAVYPSFEQNKMLWFWPNSDPQFKDIHMKKKPPYIEELDDPSYTSTFGIRDLQYGYEVLIENLMDPAHVPYAHYGIMRIPKRIASTGRDREGGRPLEISVQTLNKSGFIAKQEAGYSEFIAPSLFFAYPIGGPRDRSGSPETLQKESSANSTKQKRFLLIFFCIPVSPGRSRVIWVFPRNVGVWVDKVVPRWMFHVGQNLILDSDLYLLHLEELKIAEVGSSNWQKACFVPTKSDALVVAFRRWLRKYSNNEVSWRDNSSLNLPATPPKEQLMDRYWSHTVQCRSCSVAVKGLKVVEVCLQIISVALVGILAAAKQHVISNLARSSVLVMALLCFVASRWLSQFIHKTFYFHDYDHAFR